GKVPLQLRQQVGIRAALEDLGDECAAGIEDVDGEGGGAFDQTEDAELIGLAVAGGVGGHVRQHHVGAPSHHGKQPVRRVGSKKIELSKADAWYFGHGQQVDRDHFALVVGRADAHGGDLAPAAGRRTEIDHHESRLEQAVLVVDFDQL